MMARMVPSADAANSGKKEVNGFAGFNVRVPHGPLNGLVIGLEYGMPLYQNFAGIQMQNQQSLTLGLRYSLL